MSEMIEEGQRLAPEKMASPDQSKNTSIRFKGSKYLFEPSHPIQEQIDDFKQFIKHNDWNGQIVFFAFKGAFKYDYWCLFEEQFRELSQLKKLSFINTQVDKEYLELLLSLYQFIQPAEISLKFTQNELDDFDLNPFFNGLIKRFAAKIKTIQIVSNPGVYKGRFVKELKLKLQQYAGLNFHFVENKSTKSFAIIRQDKGENIEPLIQKFERGLRETYYLKLNFDNCFTQKNSEALNTLIQLIYDEDNMEQLEELSLDGCVFQSPQQFVWMCKCISQSKGLLSLGLSNQELLDDFEIVTSICGDRYNQLRINYLDISKSKTIDEESVYLLCEKLVSRSLKHWKIHDTFGDPIVSTVGKIQKLTDAFQSTQQEKQKSYLKSIDLTTVNTVDRTDVTVGLLQSFLFNNFNSLQQISLQYLTNTIVKSSNQIYEQFIKENPLSRLALKQINISFRNQDISEKHFIKFLRYFLLTTEQDPFQIQKCRIEQTSSFKLKCFNALKILLEGQSTQLNLQYELQQISFTNTGIGEIQGCVESIFKDIVFRKNSKVTHVEFTNESFLLEDKRIYDTIDLQQRKLDTETFFQLQSLSLVNIHQVQIDILRFIGYFVFNKFIRLKNLTIEKIILKFERKSLQDLDIMNFQFDGISHLEFLTLGGLEGDIELLNQYLLKYLIFDTKIRLKHLKFINQFLGDDIYLGQTLSNLEQFTMIIDNSSKARILSEKDQRFLIQNYICSPMMVKLELSMNMGSVFDEIDELFDQVNPQTPPQKQITQLILTDCVISPHFFQQALFSQKFNIKKLVIKNCRKQNSFTQSMEQLKKSYGDDILSGSLGSFNIEQFIFDDTPLPADFDWFLKNIIFNKYRQRLQSIQLSKCNLNDTQVSSLIDCLTALSKHRSECNLRGFIVLREVNFRDNPNLSTEILQTLFQKLFSLQVEEADEDLQDNMQQSLVSDTKINIDEEQEQYLNYHRNIMNEVLKSFHQEILNDTQQYLPVQLKKVQLDQFISTNESTDEELQFIQQMDALVFFKDSQVEELILNLKNLQQFNSYFQGQEQSKLKILKRLSLSNIMTEDTLQLKLLVDIIFQKLTLQALTLQNMNQNCFFSEMLSITNWEYQTLKEISLKDLIFEFDEQRTVLFLQTLILSHKLKLEKLKIEFCQTLLFSTLVHEFILGIQPGTSQLKSLIWRTSDSQSYQIIQKLIPFMLNSDFFRLRVLKIQCNDQIIIDLLQDVVPNRLATSTIEILSLKTQIQFNSNLLSIMQQLRGSLKKIKLPFLQINKQSEEDLISFRRKFLDQIASQSRFQILVDQQPQVFFWNDFIFADLFEFSQINIVGNVNILTLPQQIQSINIQPSKLKCLVINLDSYQGQCLFNAFDQIGENFIYNTESVLETLELRSLNLCSMNILELTQGAAKIRSKAKNDGLNKSLKLSLLHLFICKETNISDSFEQLFKDLIFFEFISLESLSLQHTELSEQNITSFCNIARQWLLFQQSNDRINRQYRFKHLDFGNQLLISNDNWEQLFSQFVFSDNSPHLSSLSLTYSNINDQVVDIIIFVAEQYFKTKAHSYKHPLRQIDFSVNSDLNVQSWRKISHRLFFSKYIQLETLNLLSAVLDSELKVEAIVNGAFTLSAQQGGKLKLHTIHTEYSHLALKLSSIMAQRPEGYQDMRILYPLVKHGQNNTQMLILPKQFGRVTALISKQIYTQQVINFQGLENPLRISQHHFRLTDGFLVHVNRCLMQDRSFRGIISLDLDTCDQLAQIFLYTQQNGSPYPYKLFFDTDSINFYEQPECCIKCLNFIYTDQKYAEVVNQFDVFKLWQVLRQKKNYLDRIYLPYEVDDTLAEHMIKQGFNEKDFVNLIRFLPPKKVKLHDITLQALKGIFSIMYDNYQFEYADILYDKHIFLNVGIGYSLREFVYRTNPSGIIGKGLKQIFYRLFNFFVSQNAKYQFDNQIKELNYYLSTQGFYFYILTTLTIIWFVICLGGPFVWQNYLTENGEFDSICKNGITPYSMYTYIIVGVLSFIVEAYLYFKVSSIIPHHIKSIIGTYDSEVPRKIQPQIPEESLFLKHNESIAKIITQKSKRKIKQFGSKVSTTLRRNLTLFARSKEGRIIGYIKNLLLGQLAKLDLYNDICFILSCYYCGLYKLALASLVVTAFNVFLSVYSLIKFIFLRITHVKSKSKLLSTQHINNFFAISIIGRNMALSTILDDVAPYNIYCIPNTTLTRKFFPKYAGRSMSNSVMGYLAKFVFEDVPQIILQLLYIYYIASQNGGLSTTMYITIVTSSISLFISFVKFMSIRPTTLSIADFDQLSESKEKSYKPQVREYLEKEAQLIKAVNLKGNTLVPDDI